MFEDKTKEVILDEMLDNVPDTIDKREGSIIYDALSPIAVELEQLYADMDLLLNESFADSASQYYLIKRAAERGILPKSGSAAVLKIQIKPEKRNLENGTYFNVGDLNYFVSENLGDGYYAITCEDEGTAGNNTADDIIPLEYIDGLESVEIVSIITQGSDDENEDSLRNRYFESFTTLAGNGNQSYYRQTANAIDGVGASKVEPVWNGEGSVKIYILGIDYATPSQELVDKVQNEIDQYQDGMGKDKAMIGHVVTVVPASQAQLTLCVNAIYEDGYTFADVKNTIETNVTEYLSSVSENWGTVEHITIRRGSIESLLLSIDGILDVLEVLLNDSTGNVIVDNYSVPVLASVEEAVNG